MSGPRHFLDLAPIPAPALRAMLDEAHRRKRARAGWPQGRADEDAPLSDHLLAMIFEKPSTRTRVSFDVAMRQLGGATIVMGAGDMQLSRGETVADTARVISRMVDGVMIRANRHEDVVDFAGAASIPVINGLTELSHPCQVLADLMTLEERLGEVKGRTIAWVGDGNNVCASFIQAAAKFAFKLRIAAPKAYAPRAQEVDATRAAGGDVRVGEDAAAAVAGADVVATDTWLSMGDKDKDARMAAFPPYSVNEALMAKAAKGAVFLHCLPAHRGEEVTDGVIDGPASAVWDEAENRIHAQKAILLWCFGKL